ncbi:MAG: PAS domain S-box protein [Candidatus Viridilinea halotolerans]|uniref:PAS domain S-box protein n=1 Tax=Candidatus Viridilinea halotolerans TaxID=2491704 RepID=A0A426TW21_9CHLR|nr:MAG: PAS domain S-box protein [Candidatus Viridilinea halotolerans]
MSSDQPTVEALQEEIARLKARVGELEQIADEQRFFRAIVDAAPDGIILSSLSGELTYANAAWHTMMGTTDNDLGTPLKEMIVEEERLRVVDAATQIMERVEWRGEWTYQRKDGTTFPGQISTFILYDRAGQPQVIAGIVRDLSEERRAEEERLTLQEQVIDAQREALREVSTPLIPLADDVVVMPLVGAIDSSRAQQIMEVLLEGIASYQADTVLLDISGVRVVDTQVADALLRSARAVQLLGAQIVLTGISADVAQTIVHLGADMGRIMTRANLQEGLRYALEERVR